MIAAISAFFGLFGLLFGAYHAVIAIVGTLKKPRVNPYSAPQKRIAAVIAARNEEAVIADLIESLKKQQYPAELFEIYVIPNNCTDDTEGAALRAGAKILPCDGPVHSKGDALRYAFQSLIEADEHDAYCIFDADNRVDSGFAQAANNALCAGYEVAQGYRDSKNPDASWVAGCTSVFFWYMDRLYNQARFALDMSVSLNGTGILVSADTLKKIGWETGSLTEDLEFTAHCALNDIKIGWMSDAITFDEQPVTLKVSIAQRRRWTAGSIQCLKRYCVPLARRAFARGGAPSLDILTIFSGPLIQLFSMIPFLSTLLLFWQQVRLDPIEGLLTTGVSLLVSALSMVVFGMIYVLLVCLLEKKMTVTRIPSMLFMSVYLASWGLINLMCLVTKPPKWVEIPHGEGKPAAKYAKKQSSVNI